MRERWKALLAEYGAVALGVYLAIFALVMGGFLVAIVAGMSPEGTAGGAGSLAAAYVATKLTQPLRIAATLAITPVVARWRRRTRIRS